MNRRDFFKIVTASGAAAAAGGCQQATESILPLVVPERADRARRRLLVRHGVPRVPGGLRRPRAEPRGAHREARGQSRPSRQRGRPLHARPGRAPGPLPSRSDRRPAWSAREAAGSSRRRGRRARSSSSRSSPRCAAPARAVRSRWCRSSRTAASAPCSIAGRQALGARPRVTLEPFAYESIRAANRITFNRDAIPYYAFEDAEVVLSFGADFIETWLSNVGYARMFARMHSFRDGRAGTFIHVEPRQSLTASNADEWVRNAPGTEGLLALAILRVMVDEGMADRRFGEAVAGVDLKKVAEDSGVAAETIKHLAKVFAHAKPGLAVGGGVAVTGSNATADAGRDQSAERGGRERRQDRPLRPRLGLRQGHALRRGGRARAARWRAARSRCSCSAPASTRRSRCPCGLKLADAIGKVAFVVSFANVPDQTSDAGARRPAGHPLARIVGRLLAARGRARACSSRRCRRSAIRGRWATCCWRVGRAALGTEEGKGPLPWPTFEQYVKSGVGAPGEGRPRRRRSSRAASVADVRRRAPVTREDRRASTPHRPSSRATRAGLDAARVSVAPVLRRAKRGQLVAPGSRRTR